jgi:uncharacterized protein YlaI
MVDVPTIAGILAALKTAKDLLVSLVQTVLQLRKLGSQKSDTAPRQEDIEAQKQVVEPKAWGAEKDRYELKRVSALPGTFAYRLRQNQEGEEAQAYLCAHCFDRGKKSILQGTAETMLKRRLYICPECKTTIAMEH